MAKRKNIQVERDQLTKWYYEDKKTTQEIADLLHIGQSTVIYWMDKLGIPRRSKPDSLINTYRANFSGDPVEKAYLLGFRLGDLHVYKVKPPNGQTIRVMCGSTRPAQIDLIRSLFEPFGYIKVVPKANGITTISGNTDTNT